MAFERGPFLTVASFCEQVIEDKFGVLSLVRLVDRKHISISGPNPPDDMPPTILDWYLVLCFKSGEARGSLTVKIIPELPSGLTIEPAIRTIYFEGGNRGPNVITRFNMKLESPGIYWFRIYMEDTLMTQVPVEIIYSRTVSSAVPPQIAQ